VTVSEQEAQEAQEARAVAIRQRLTRALEENPTKLGAVFRCRLRALLLRDKVNGAVER